MANLNDDKLNNAAAAKGKNNRMQEGGSKVIGTDGLGLEDALGIAHGVKSQDDGSARKTTQAANDTILGEKAIPKKLEYQPPDELAGKKAVKGSFDFADKTNLPLTPTQQYADVSSKIIEEQNVPIVVPIASEKLPQTKLAKPPRAVSKPQKRAYADYDMDGDINGAVAKNESYLIAVGQSRRKKKIIALIVLLIFLLFLLTFGVSVIVSKTTGFTVNMSGSDAQKGLTLYDNAELKGGSSQLITDNVPECDNQTYSELIDGILNTVDKGNGQQSMKFWYFAYSFYVQNIGKGEVDYDFKVSIGSTSRGLDDAIRVLVIDDSTYYGAKNNVRNFQVYAKPKSDDDGNWQYDSDNRPIMQKLYDPLGNIYPDNKQDNALPFFSPVVPVNKSVKKFGFKEGQNLRKYTIVIYIEGGDEDCLNRLKGGGIKFKADFTVTDYRIEI